MIDETPYNTWTITFEAYLDGFDQKNNRCDHYTNADYAVAVGMMVAQ